MNVKIRTHGKTILSKIIPDSPKLRYLSFLPKLETWRRKHSKQYPIFKYREEMYKYVNDNILNNGKIDFLEFGVYKGDSIKCWSELNSCKDSRFFGFDTFSGLPETWNIFISVMPVGCFDTDGILPYIKDARVSFIKGLFQDTLPPFKAKYDAGPKIIIHNDADLYSSTLYVLTSLNDIIIEGSIIIFDEFSSVLDEFRALDDYCSSYRRDYEVIAATMNYSQIAILMK